MPFRVRIPSVKRRLLNTLAAMSLLLCVASLLLWCRACRYRDRLQIHTAGGIYVSVCSMGGQLRLESSAHFFPQRRVQFDSSTDLSWGFDPAWPHWGGFAIGT